MKRLLAILFLAATCWLPARAQTSPRKCAPPPPETDWKQNGLNGRVKAISTLKSWFSKDEKTGKIVEGEREFEEEASYDAAGNMTAWKNVSYLPADPNSEPKPAYRCDSGRVIETRFTNPDGSLYEKQTFSYDGKGRLLEKARYFSESTLESRQQYRRDEKGMVVEEIVTQHIHPEHFSPKRYDVYVTSSTTYKYDNKGNLSEEKDIYPDGSVYATWAKTYDKAGRLVRVLRTDKQGRAEDLDVYTYDSRGVLVEEWQYNNSCYELDGRMCPPSVTTDAGGFHYGTKTVYINDSHRNWVTQTEYVVSEQNGVKAFEPLTAMYRKITYY